MSGGDCCQISTRASRVSDNIIRQEPLLIRSSPVQCVVRGSRYLGQGVGTFGNRHRGTLDIQLDLGSALLSVLRFPCADDTMRNTLSVNPIKCFCDTGD